MANLRPLSPEIDSSWLSASRCSKGAGTLLSGPEYMVSCTHCFLKWATWHPCCSAGGQQAAFKADCTV